MKLKTVAAAAALLALPAVSQAGEVAGFTTSGYVDVSFQHNDWDDSPAVAQPATLIGNIGDDDSFSLNQAALKLSKTPDSGFGAVVGVVMGDQAAIFPSNAGGGDVALTHGYVQYANGPITVMGGKFQTILGYEVFASPDNAQATRGLLWMIQPLSLTGVRGTAKLGDMFSVTVGAVNELNGETADGSDDQKTLELQAALTAQNFNVLLTHYATSESVADASSGTLPTAFTDLVAGFTAGAFNLGLNVDLVTFDDAADTEATGFAVYAGFKVSDAFRLSGRFESLTVEDNSGLPDDELTSITVTAGMACAKDFDLLLEARNDSVDNSTAFDGDDSGNTFVAKGIYKF